MRKSIYILVSTFLLLSGCKDSNTLNDEKLKAAINLYLENHEQTCIWLGQPFPIDVSKLQLRRNEGVALQMRTLENAGVVQSIETVNRVQNPFGGNTQQNVRRYEPTVAGKRYFRQVRAVMTRSTGFCYGMKTVNSIISFTKPSSIGPALTTRVNYTYKLRNLASWARRADIQNEFGDIRTTIGGASKSNETIVLQLTNKGWEVPVQ